MTRRTAREGTIRHRDDGRWEARYRAGDGRQRSIYSTTSADAKRRLREALTAADNGVRPADGRLTVKAYLDEWIRTSVRPRLRATTADSYESIVDLYLVPELGRLPLAKLEPAHVQTMLAKVAALTERQRERRRSAAAEAAGVERSARKVAAPERRLSQTTVRYVYAVLRIALGRALKTGLVVRNVATLVDAPPKARHELTPLTATEATTFLEATRGDAHGALYATAIGLGLRQGELLGLRWSDIDWKAGTLTVRNSLQRGTRELAEPKTERARRTLILPAFVAAALREHQRIQAEQHFAGADGYVFASQSGTSLDPRNVTRAFHAALRRAGLPRQRFHDLRHATATLLLEQGEELGIVSRILGHASLSTTADVYAHFTRGMQQRAADRMDALFGVPAEAR